MNEIVKEFGIQWPLLVASIVNFVILLFLMKKFLYKPVLKILDERKEMIEKSVKTAEQIEKDKEKTEERIKVSLRLANDEAMKVIARSHASAEKAKDVIIKEAEIKAGEIVEQAKEEIKRERERASAELKAESANLISEALKKIIIERKDDIDDERLIKEVAEKIGG